MDGEPLNQNDPAFLASLSLDEELDCQQRSRLDDALRTSASLRTDLEQLGAVDQIVRRLGNKAVEIDWEHHAALIQARVAGEDDSKELQQVDELLQRWGEKKAVPDQERFTQSVLSRIARPRTRRLGNKWVFRLGAPLAAAAAIAFVLVGRSFIAESRDPVCLVRIGSSLAMRSDASLSSASPSVVVSYARDPIDPVRMSKTGISLGSVGAGPLEETYWVEAPL